MKKLFMASVALITFAVSIILFEMSSCTKSDAQTSISNTINGLWVGTTAINGQSNLGNLYFSPIIKPDGTLIVESLSTGGIQHLANGNWTLVGDTLSGTYTCVYGIPQNIGIAISFKGVWNKSGNILGTWKNINMGYTGTGTFTVNKIN